MGIFDHSSRSTFMRSHTDAGQEGLALSLHSNSSQRCSVGLRSGLCAGQSSSSTPSSLLHVFMNLALCTGVQSCWNRKGPSPNCSHKIPPPSKALHLAQCSKTSTVLLANAKPRLVHQIARWRGVICHSREGVSTAPLHFRLQWWRALHHCIRCFALHLLMYGLDSAALPWKPIP